MQPDFSTPATDAANIVLLSAWFSGIPFAYFAYLLNRRRLKWKADDPRLILLSLAIGGLLIFLMMRMFGSDGVWPAGCAMFGWYAGMWYAAYVIEKRRRRRRYFDPTQRLLFEQMTGNKLPDDEA
jgi:O-antigen/teichoic acid export membrane protein